MAKSRFEYVKFFEKDDTLLPNTWILVRLDGRGFHGFSKAHTFAKPNDIRALHLMNAAAKSLMREISDIVLAYGESDEYSFLLGRDCKLYNRREFKIVTTFVSLFTSYYVYYWKEHFPDTPLKYPPSFDGRAVLYPDAKNVRDYFAWRQADCHINNLHNTAYWSLIKKGMSEQEATKALEGTEASDKNELLWSGSAINYAKEPAMFRKGTALFRETEEVVKTDTTPSGSPQLGSRSSFEDSESSVAQSTAIASEGQENGEELPHEETSATADTVSNSHGNSTEGTLAAILRKQKKGRTKRRPKRLVLKEDYIDIIRDDFWDAHASILA